MTASHDTALVLGGGGLTGIAWETGILLGLERRGISLRSSELIVGTSAGSAVAAQIAGPTSLDDLFEAQIEGRVQELPGKLGLLSMLKLLLALKGTANEQAALAKVGKHALRATTPAEPVRRAVIEQRLPVHEWPAKALRIPAVNARTGELVVFDASSGVDLIDSVAASCAVPMVWPSVTIDSKRYFDGGIRSTANVDLAAGYERIVVITPGASSLRKGTGPGEQLAASGAARSALIAPDDPAKTAMGRNSLDPAARASAARAGLAQAKRVVDLVQSAWD